MSTLLWVTRPIRQIPAPVRKKQNRNNNNNQLSDIEVFCLLAEAKIERVTHQARRKRCGMAAVAAPKICRERERERERKGREGRKEREKRRNKREKKKERKGEESKRERCRPITPI